MLRLLAKSLQQHADSGVLQRFYVFSILLAYFDSPLADRFTRPLILDVLRQARTHLRAFACVLRGSVFLSFWVFVCLGFRTFHWQSSTSPLNYL
jgi:hypothetical protein